MVKIEEYPTFHKGELTEYYDRIPKRERKIIEDFLKFISITAGDRRIDEAKRVLTQFRKLTHKSLDKIDLSTLRNYLSLLNSSNKTNNSRNDIKATVKRFLRWKYKDWSNRFNELQDIKLIVRMNEEKINSNTLLKKEEVESIVKAEPQLFWKTLFLTLYESGLRPNELRHLTWDMINLNVDGVLSEINIFATKTHRARSVYVKEATKYLQELKNRDRTGSPLVFPAPHDSTKPLSRTTVSVWLNRISEKAIGRRVFPYLLRHTRATELYVNAKIPDKIAQKILGHNKSMGDVYTHLSNKDVKEAMGKIIYNLNDLPEEKKQKLEKRIVELEENQEALINSFDMLLEQKGMPLLPKSSQ